VRDHGRIAALVICTTLLSCSLTLPLSLATLPAGESSDEIMWSSALIEARDDLVMEVRDILFFYELGQWRLHKIQRVLVFDSINVCVRVCVCACLYVCFADEKTNSV
jgi:hypothetical protein